MSLGFLRRNTHKHSKIGRGRKKLQKWRKPKGRDNKMRLKEKGYPKTVSIGYGKQRKEYGRIEGKVPVLVGNFKDLESISKENVAVLSSRVGAKKKIEIMKKAEEMKIKILNVKKENKK